MLEAIDNDIIRIVSVVGRARLSAIFRSENGLAYSNVEVFRSVCRLRSEGKIEIVHSGVAGGRGAMYVCLPGWKND